MQRYFRPDLLENSLVAPMGEFVEACTPTTEIGHAIRRSLVDPTGEFVEARCRPSRARRRPVGRSSLRRASSLRHGRLHDAHDREESVARRSDASSLRRGLRGRGSGPTGSTVARRSDGRVR